MADHSGLHLVHDVLDAQLLDRKKEKVGRANAVVLELEDGRPPRVAAILIGGPVRAQRIGAWMVVLEQAMRSLGRIRRAGVSRIPFAAVRCIADTIELDVDAGELEAGHLETWLRDHIVCHIPFSKGEKK